MGYTFRKYLQIAKISYFHPFICSQVHFCTSLFATQQHYLASLRLINFSMYVYVVLNHIDLTSENLFKDFRLKSYITIPLTSQNHFAVRTHIQIRLHKIKHAYTQYIILHYIHYTHTITYCNYINTFAASYLNTQGLNNSYLKSPASTLVDLTFQSRALHSFSLNQLRNLSL